MNEKVLLNINVVVQKTRASLKMKLILCMFLGITLVPCILGQLWAIENIGALISFMKTAGIPFVTQESSANKDSGETE